MDTYKILISCTFVNLESKLEKIESNPNFIKWPKDPMFQLAEQMDSIDNVRIISEYVKYVGNGKIGKSIKSSKYKNKMSTYELLKN
jgi:hypothetical protein